jgi:DNA-binding LacI/PurR family transcriptional regulator
MKLENPDTPDTRNLNDRPDIMKKKCKQVKRTASASWRLPHSFAQKIRMNNSKTIGVIVPEINNDFFSTAISGIEEVASQSGYLVLLCQSNESYEKEVADIILMIRDRVAGVIVSVSQNTKSGSHFNDLRKQNIPLVFFDRVCDDFTASNVKIDDYKSAFDAVAYLIGRGYKRIAHFAGPKELGISEKRLKGYLDALGQSQMLHTNLVFHGGLQERDGYKLMDSLVQSNTIPDAIFAVNDPVALGAYKRIKEAGLKIPNDVALIGFSNNEFTTFTNPQMTTVDQPSFEMGRKSAEILIGTIEERIKDIKTLVLDTKLIIRGSA